MEMEKETKKVGLYWKILLVVAAVWGVFFALSFIKSFDDWYVDHIFPAIQQVVGRIFNVFPFAFGEILMYFCALLVLVTVILSLVFGIRWIVRKCRKKTGKRNTFYRVYMKSVLVVAVLFLWAYLFHWWIPYNGHVFGEKNQDRTRGFTAQEYRYVRIQVGIKCMEAMKAIPRDADGRIIYPDKKTAYEVIARNVKKLSDRYPRLKGYYSKPKAALCSDVLEWMYIGGYTYPYTMEITYNKYVDNLYWYTMIAHETAHYKGFYKENEGECMGILACILSDDPLMVYSGCADYYFTVESKYINAMIEDYGLEEGMKRLKEEFAQDPDYTLDEQQIFLDQEDAARVAQEAYEADSHPLENYSDTAEEVADTGWETQEVIAAENYYDDGYRLIMEYFLKEREEGR